MLLLPPTGVLELFSGVTLKEAFENIIKVEISDEQKSVSLSKTDNV